MAQIYSLQPTQLPSLVSCMKTFLGFLQKETAVASSECHSSPSSELLDFDEAIHHMMEAQSHFTFFRSSPDTIPFVKANDAALYERTAA